MKQSLLPALVLALAYAAPSPAVAQDAAPSVTETPVDVSANAVPAPADPAQPGADTTVAPAEPAANAAEERRCRTVRETGSRVGAQRICETEQSQRLRSNLEASRAVSTAMSNGTAGAR